MYYVCHLFLRQCCVAFDLTPSRALHSASNRKREKERKREHLWVESSLSGRRKEGGAIQGANHVFVSRDVSTPPARHQGRLIILFCFVSKSPVTIVLLAPQVMSSQFAQHLQTFLFPCGASCICCCGLPFDVFLLVPQACGNAGGLQPLFVVLA